MNAMTMLTNAVRRLDAMFPGYFNTTTKRDHYIDYGYPAQLTFEQFWQMYQRNGVAGAAVRKTVSKTWQTNPQLFEGDEAGELTKDEQALADRLTELRFWQKLAEADKRSLVGKYAALIFRFADNLDMDQPVGTVPGGLDGLVEIIPAWESQLTVAEWDDVPTSEGYGKPLMYEFKEMAVGGDESKRRQFSVHPDRVFIWSHDESVHGENFLSAGYNNLIDIEKVLGAGGEGFWKNAKSAPVLEVDKEASAKQMAQAMGVAEDKLADKMNEQVEDWQKGFDALLMLQGIEAKTLEVSLLQPEGFYSGPLQCFAASIEMPVKILIGMQTGERASQEDQKEWAQTCMSRREDYVLPNISAIVKRLVEYRVFAKKTWSIVWTDLTESSMNEKIDRTVKMADVNTKHKESGEWVFTPEEIRQVAGYEPLSDKDKYRDPADDSEEEAALDITDE